MVFGVPMCRLCCALGHARLQEASPLVHNQPSLGVTAPGGEEDRS